MTTPPPLTPPRWGDPIHKDLAYVKRASAENQAAHWNAVLVCDSLLGPGSGFVVGVGPRREGRYPLVWLPQFDLHVARPQGEDAAPPA